MYLGLRIKCPTFLPDFNETLTFSTNIRKNQILNFMKIRLVGVQLCRMDRRTDGNNENNNRIPQFCESVWKLLFKKNV
jgi:hypothetical protein